MQSNIHHTRVLSSATSSQIMPAKKCNTPDDKHDLRILVAADDRVSRETLRDLIGSWGFTVRTVASNQLLEQVQSFAPHVLLLDIEAQQKDGEAALREVQSRGIDVATIVMGEEADVRFFRADDQARHLRFRLQADYSEQPARAVKRADDSNQCKPGKSAAPAETDRDRHAWTDHRTVIRDAPRDAAGRGSGGVKLRLGSIVGEPGTGKKLVARTIHELSARRNGPYVRSRVHGIA